MITKYTNSSCLTNGVLKNLWHDIFVLRVCLCTACIPFVQSTGKYSNYFTFKAKFFFIFLQLQSREKEVLYVCSVFFACYLCYPSFIFFAIVFLDADIINIHLVICFSKHFMQCVCVYGKFLYQRLVYSLFICLFVCCYRSFLVLFTVIFLYAVKVQVYFFFFLFSSTSTLLPALLNGLHSTLSSCFC